MPGETVDFEVASAIGAELPFVTASAGARGLALKTAGRILACRAIHRSAEPGSLMVCVGPGRRDALLADAPAACYTTAHYRSHPVVLVRLSQVDRAVLRGLLQDAWVFVRGEAD